MNDDIGEYDTTRGRDIDPLGSDPWVRAYEHGGDRGGTIGDRSTPPLPSPEEFSERTFDNSAAPVEGSTNRGTLGQEPDGPLQRLFDGLF